MEDLRIAYCEAFELAEKYLKDAERFVGFSSPDDLTLGDFISGVLVPAINELRYAGRHAAQALQNSADSNTEYDKAIRHCNRACFDAIDAQVQYYLAECRQFSIDYSRVVVSTVIKDYGADKSWLNQFKLDLSANVNVPKEDRWQWLVANLPNLRDINMQWDGGREDLNKMLEEANSIRWHRTVTTVISVIVAAATVISTIIGFAVYQSACHP